VQSLHDYTLAFSQTANAATTVAFATLLSFSLLLYFGDNK